MNNTEYIADAHDDFTLEVLTETDVVIDSTN